MQVHTAIHSLGPDWLTGYVPAAQEETQVKLAEFIYELEVKALEQGYRVLPVSFNGYAGTRIGGVSVAYNDAGAMVVHLTGQTARATTINALQLGARPSRLDLQVTVLTSRELEGVAERAARLSDYAAKQTKHPWTAKHYETFGLGDTAYIGSETSDQFARIYDKAKESKKSEYLNCWRYELILKNEYAIHYARQLLSSKLPLDTLRAVVYDWLANRGVEPLFDRGSLEYSMYKEETNEDLNNKLVWLKRAVQPVIIRLLEAGKVNEVKEAIPLEILIQNCTEKKRVLLLPRQSVGKERL